MPPRYLVFLFLAFILLGGAPASADEMTIDDTYTIDVPKGWTVTNPEPGYMIFISPNQSAVFLITTGQSIPKHREKTANMVKRYDHLRIGSPDRFVTLMRVRNKRVAVTILGDHPDRVKTYWSIKEAAGDKMKAWRND